MPFPFGLILGTGGAPATISDLSQNTGTFLGGTAITLTGEGFSAPMTSTLGSVAVIDSTTAVLTTNASPTVGATTFTVTNGDGHVITQVGSTVLAYRYQPLPVFRSVIPPHGPATASANDFIFAISGLPPDDSGCPVVIHIGTATADNLAAPGPAMATGDLVGGSGLGAVTCEAIIDGVSTGLISGLYTGDNPPTIASIGTAGTAGSTVNISGTFFTSTSVVRIAGTIATFLYSSATNGKLVVPPMGVGSYTVTMTNPDNQVATDVNGLVVSTVRDPETIGGSDTLFDWRAVNALATGTNVTSVTDVSGSTHPLHTSMGSPQLSAAGVNIPGPSIVNSVADGMSTGSASSVPFTGNSMTFMLAGYVNGQSASAQAIMTASMVTTGKIFGIDIFSASSSTIAVGYTAGTHASWGSPMTGKGFICVFSIVGSGGTNNDLAISMDNQTPVTATQTGQTIPATSMEVAIGYRSGNHDLNTAMEWSLAAGFQRLLNATDRGDLVQWAQLTSGIDAPPTFTEITSIPANTAGAAFRIQGTGFATTGVQAKVSIAGVDTTLTVAEMFSDSVGFTGFPSTAAGTLFVLVVTNPDGSGFAESIQFMPDGSDVITSSNNPMTDGGLQLRGWYEGDRLTESSNLVSSIFNQALLSVNTYNQAVGADQPTYLSVNANFLNAPTFGTLGSPVFMAIAALFLNSTVKTYMYVCLRQTTATGTQTVFELGGITLFGNVAAGKPDTVGGTTHATAVSTIGTTSHVIMYRHDTTNVGAELGVQVDGNPEVTAAKVQAVVDNQAFNLFALFTSAQYFQGEVACIAISTVPLPHFRSYCQTKFGAP